MTNATNPTGPGDFGPGHEDVSKVIRQALSLTESQAFALRRDRDQRLSPTWLGLHASAVWELAGQTPGARGWITSADEAAEAAVWWVADSWGDQPLEVRASRRLSGMAARSAAGAAAFAARRAALGAVTAHLVNGAQDTITPSQHATFAAAWRTVFP